MGSIEHEMRVALSVELGEELHTLQFQLPNGARIEVEGINDARTVLVQFVGNRGAFKPQHRNKAMADLFKLNWLRSSQFPGSRAILCVGETTAQVFRPLAWPSIAARDLGIAILLYHGEGRITRLVED